MPALTDLTAATTLASADIFLISQGGASRSAAFSLIVSAMESAISVSGASVAIAGQSTTRTLAARFADILNLKDFGAVGNGTTDDSAAVTAWLGEVALGGYGYAPPGQYACASSVTATVAGVPFNIEGAGQGATRFLFTGATDGMAITVEAVGGVWGSVQLSDFSITRSPTSPAQAHTGLSITGVAANAAQNGNNGLRNIALDITAAGTSWTTGIKIVNVGSVDFDTVRVTGPFPSSAGSDAAVSINGTAAMFISGLSFTNCLFNGFSSGLQIGNYVQGVYVANSSMLANWRSINWVGAMAPVNYSTTAATAAGAPINVGPTTAALLIPGMLLNSTNLAPQSILTAIGTTYSYPTITASTVGSSGNLLNISPAHAALLQTIVSTPYTVYVSGPNIPANTLLVSANASTGVLVMNQYITGTVASGASISFQAIDGTLTLDPVPTGAITSGQSIAIQLLSLCEELNVLNSSFSGAIADIYLQYVSLSSIVGNTFLRWCPNPASPPSSTWAAIAIQDGNNNTVAGNTILGAFTGAETGIYNSSQIISIAYSPNAITGNAISSIAGVGIVIGGVGASTAGGTLRNTTVNNNPTEAVTAGVVTAIENSNQIYGNQYNAGPPDLCSNTTNGTLSINSASGIYEFANLTTPTALSFNLHHGGTGVDINILQNGVQQWLIGAGPTDFAVARYAAGVLADIPFTIDAAAGNVTILHNLTVTGTLSAGTTISSASGLDVTSATVTLTGQSTARSLEARFADILNIKDFGARGDNSTDDTAAFEAWLAALAAGGGYGYAPAGKYLLSTAVSQTIAGLTVHIEGAATGVTEFIFTGNTNGLAFNLTRSGLLWGGIRLSDISILRRPSSPPQAHTGLSIIADPTQNIGYNGTSGLSDVFVGGNGQVSSWSTGILLSSVTELEMRNVTVLGPNGTAGGTDIGISIVGVSAAMFAVSIDTTDSLVQGFSTGMQISGFVQGIFVENCSIIGDWWGINWLGAGPATTCVTTNVSQFASFTGSIATVTSGGITTTTLTIAGSVTGTIQTGMVLGGTGVSVGTKITGGSGTSWTLDTPQTVSSTTMTAGSEVLHISPANAALWVPGDIVNAANLPPMARIVSIGTPTIYATTAATASGNLISVSTGNATAIQSILSAGISITVSGTNMAYDCTVSSVNTSTGVVTLSASVVGAIANGAAITFLANDGTITLNEAVTAQITASTNITFQTYYLAEELSVVNSSFNGGYRDILVNWGSFVQVTNNTFLQFGNSTGNWAGIDLEECNNNNIVANQLIAYHSGTETGIIVAALGYAGTTPNVIIGNSINGVAGPAISLGGSGSSTTNSSVTGATVIGNIANAAEAIVNSNKQNANMIFGNSGGGGYTPEFSFDSTTGAFYCNAPSNFFYGAGTTIGADANSATNLALNASVGMPKQLLFNSASVTRWLQTVSGTNSGSNTGDDLFWTRVADNGTEIDAPMTLVRSTGAVKLLHDLTVGGAILLGTAGPTVTTGNGAPTATQPKGSLYSRQDGAVGSTLYVSQGGGTWNPVSGV